MLVYKDFYDMYNRNSAINEMHIFNRYKINSGGVCRMVFRLRLR